MALALDIGSWLCLVVGSIFCVIGGLGTLRLPDLYTRAHSASITDTLGAGLVLLGCALQADAALVAVKLVMIYALMLYTGPAATHALVKAAYARGVLAAGIPDREQSGPRPSDNPTPSRGPTENG